jgi:hypothetical protein
LSQDKSHGRVHQPGANVTRRRGGVGLRANYLHEISALGDKGERLDENPRVMAKLKDLRIAYEEGVAAFDHLRHAMDRSYIDFDEG